MATHASAEKAARQATKRQNRNLQVVSRCKTSIKKLRTAIVAKYGTKDEALKALGPLLSNVQKTLMKAASKRIMKPKTASRHISRLSSAVHKVLGA